MMIKVNNDKSDFQEDLWFTEWIIQTKAYLFLIYR